MINHAMGMPHNPALLPLGLFDYEAYKMTFWQRTLNTMATNLIEVARNYYLVPKVEAILDDMLPGVERPSLLDLEKGADILTLKHKGRILRYCWDVLKPELSGRSLSSYSVLKY